MLKFTVTIDLELSEIIAAYKHHFQVDKKPTKKDIARWIGSLAEADIVSVLPDNYEDIED